MINPPYSAAIVQVVANYLRRWRGLSRPARLYLLHAAFLTGSLAIVSLFFNLAIKAFGYPREFLGLLNSLSIGVAAALSLPLWWLVTQIGLRQAMVLSATLQLIGVLVLVLWPATTALLAAVSLTGAAAVLFQVSAPPFMMRHSDTAARDHLFSANAAINIGVAGLGSLIAGPLPALFGHWLGVDRESALAYRGAFALAGAGLLAGIVPLLLISECQAAETASRESMARPGAADQMRVITAGAARPGMHDLSTSLGAGASRGVFRVLLARIPAPYHALLRRPWPLLRLLIPPFIISWGAALLIRYLNLFFKERFAISDDLLGAIFAMLNITTGLAALFAPVISMRMGKIRTVALTQALSIPFLLALGFVPVLEVAAGAAVIRAALFNMGSPLYDAFAMEQTEEPARPVVIGLINGAYTAGYLIGPYISTLVQARYGFAPLFVATAICYTLAMLANYWLFVRHANREAGAVSRT